MNERLTIQDLIDLLAAKHSMTKKDAEAFVKEFFLLIEQALENEKTVKIKGLGTFKLVDVDSRESVNVNTGERFQIKGHTKVSFTPDTNLRDTINKPFAHFETVVLNEGTVLEDTPMEESDEEEGAVSDTETEMIDSEIAGNENAGGDIIEEDEGQAIDIDVQIQLRVRQDFLRGADQPQKAVTAGDTQDHQRRTYRRTENAGGVDRRLHALIVFGAKQLGHNDGTAHIAAKGKGQENQSDFVAVAHGGQGILADEFSGYQAVGNVVKLLENDAAQQRDTELPQHLIRRADGKILIHFKTLLMDFSQKFIPYFSIF